MKVAPATSIPDIQLFRDAFNASPIGIAVENFEGQPLFVNPAFCRFLGFTEEELQRKHCVDFSPKEDADKDWALFQQLRARAIDHYQMEKRYFRRDGSLVWGSLSISLLNSRPSPLVLAMIEDITDKKRAEESLRVSEERLRLAQQAARIGTFEWNIETGVNTWTPELEAMYGLSPGGFGGTQTAFENLVHPDDRARVVELDNWALKTGQPTTGEWRVVWADGSVHWIAGRWQVYMNESGQPSRMVGVNTDVTERKLAEQELATASERLRLAIESGSVGGWDYNLKTGKKVWFGETHAQLGTAPDEAQGSFEESWGRIYKDDREHLQHALRVARDKHEQFTEEFRVVWRDGTTRWVRSRGRFFYAANGEPERLLGLSVDITERKLAEEELRQSDERFRLALQAGKMYAYEWDVATDVLTRSSEHMTILGVTEPQGIARQQFLSRIHPDDRSKFIATVAGLTPAKPTGDITYRVQLPNGTIWLKNSGRAFFDGEGRMLRVVGMVANVTDQKLAEEALSGMARKLVEAQEQERARIARELHDDINQRLAMLAVELGQAKQNHPDLPPDILNWMHGLQQQTTQISVDVQALSHDLHSSQLEYLGVVAGIKSWCKEFGERHGMQIDCKHDVRSTLPAEIGLCLFRVLQEALHNAAKHSGVKRVEVDLHEEEGEIHLVVRDSGRGFDVEAVKQGKGLGLTSMRERVRLVNGTIAIVSKPMGGTTIHVRVPLGSEKLSERAVG